MGGAGYVDLLGDAMLLELAATPPDVRRAVEHLVSANPVARTLGIDGIVECVGRQGTLRPTAPEAVPFLLALALSPRYPHASALLTRLGVVVETIDDPPRSLAAGRGDPLALRVFEQIGERVPGLLRVARSSRDPESCRAAALVASHFPRADAELEPVLLALLTGARDAQERARLLYCFARVQGARGGPFHPRIDRALGSPGAGVEKAAAALALAELPLHASLRARVTRALEDLAAAGDPTGQADPRAWGTRWAAGSVAGALARLRQNDSRE